MSVDLSEAVEVIEGLIFGDATYNLPDPGLGLSKPDGLFLGAPLTVAKFLKDKQCVVWRPITRNPGIDRQQQDTQVNDEIHVALSLELPKTGNQRPKRREAYILDKQIRGRVVKPGPLQQRGLDAFYIQTTERGALWPDPVGYGSYGHIVLESVYRMVRIESLTGGPS